MAKLRSVSTAFWSDPFVEELSPSEKLLFLYLVTNEKTNMLGIYESSVKKIAFETGIRKDDVLKHLKGFERVGKVKYINNYVVLVNFMKHQNFNTNMKKSAIDIYNNLPNMLKENELNISKSNPSEGFETLLNAFGMVPKREVEVEYEVETEYELETKEEVKKEETLKPKVFKAPFSLEVEDCYLECLKYFDEHLHPRLEKSVFSWKETIEKLNRIDKIPFEKIVEITQKTRADSFWGKNFLSLNKLRNKNKDKTMYIVVFNEQIKSIKNESSSETIGRQTLDTIKRNTDWSSVRRH